MQTKTKKIIAREIMIFFSLFLLSILFFLGNLLYNKFKSWQISEYDKKLLAINSSIDSLQGKVRLLLNDNSIYRFFKANNLTEKDELTFLSTYKNPDSAKLIYDFMRVNKLTDLSEASFYNKYLSHMDVDKYFLIQNQLKLKKGELYNIEVEKSAAQDEVLTKNKIRRNMVWFFAISFVAVYLLRPSIKILKWSFQTLRS